MILRLVTSFIFLVVFVHCLQVRAEDDGEGVARSMQLLQDYADELGRATSKSVGTLSRFKRDDADGGVTHLDIRDAILQLLKVIRDSSKKSERQDKLASDTLSKILLKVSKMERNGPGGQATVRKIDNISTFLLRMNSKLDSIDRQVKKGGRGTSGGGGGSSAVLENLAQESYDILTLLPTYIENTKDAIAVLSRETKDKFIEVEELLVDNDEGEESGTNGTVAGHKRSLAKVLKSAEANILSSSNELKEIVIESGHMAESLMESVNDGYASLTDELKGLSKVEKVLLDTADSVMDTKKKIEFGVKQIMYKIGELVKLSGGKMDDNLKAEFEDITRTILDNQNKALGNLTTKVEKELGQVWRQMGIMYNQVSSSIQVLEKVKSQTEGYVNRTGNNLGTMEGQVEGLSDRMVDVDENLNYMLGQLSLVVQEFNQVKTGLANAINGTEAEISDLLPEYERENEQG